MVVFKSIVHFLLKETKDCVYLLSYENSGGFYLKYCLAKYPALLLISIQRIQLINK